MTSSSTLRIFLLTIALAVTACGAGSEDSGQTDSIRVAAQTGIYYKLQSEGDTIICEASPKLVEGVGFSNKLKPLRLPGESDSYRLSDLSQPAREKLAAKETLGGMWGATGVWVQVSKNWERYEVDNKGLNFGNWLSKRDEEIFAKLATDCSSLYSTCSEIIQSKWAEPDGLCQLKEKS